MSSQTTLSPVPVQKNQFYITCAGCPVKLNPEQREAGKIVYEVVVLKRATKFDTALQAAQAATDYGLIPKYTKIVQEGTETPEAPERGCVADQPQQR